MKICKTIRLLILVTLPLGAVGDKSSLWSPTGFALKSLWSNSGNKKSVAPWMFTTPYRTKTKLLHKENMVAKNLALSDTQITKMDKLAPIHYCFIAPYVAFAGKKIFDWASTTITKDSIPWIATGAGFASILASVAVSQQYKHDYETRNQEFRKENKELQHKNSTLQHNLQATKRNATKQHKELIGLREIKDLRNREIVDSKSELFNQKMIILRLESELKKNKAETFRQSRENFDLKDKLTNTPPQVRIIGEDTEDLRERNNRLSNHNKYLAERLSTVGQDKYELQKQNEEQRKTIFNLQGMLTGFRYDNELLRLNDVQFIKRETKDVETQVNEKSIDTEMFIRNELISSMIDRAHEIKTQNSIIKKMLQHPTINSTLNNSNLSGSQFSPINRSLNTEENLD